MAQQPTAMDGGGRSAPSGPSDQGSFDVFLSYNRREEHLVERIAIGLRRAGIEPWVDIWSITPGGVWQDEVAEGLGHSRTCAVLVGPNDLGGWGRIEMAVAMDRTTRDPDFRVFPVLLPGLEPFDPNTLPLLLRTRTWVDMRAGADDPRALRELICAIKALPFGPHVEVKPQAGTCPYRGLETFEEQHAQFFVGREGDVQRLLEQLKRSRFLTVLGPSGSGKSSLVRAGLVPALRAGGVPGSERWRVRVFRPGGRPLAGLAAQLLADDGRAGMQETLDGLARDNRTLHLAVELAFAEENPEARVLLVLDQFEEVFTLCRSETERRATLDNLVYATTIPGGRAVAVLTLRADWYPRLAAYPQAAQLAQSSQALVGAPDEASLQRVIVEPAMRAGLELEAGLAETILDDVAREPGGLPLLEHALLETWERRRGQMLTLEGYRASGGVRDALCERAEEMFGELCASEQGIARHLLLRLTQPGEGTEDTRRRAALSELVTSEADRAAVEAVVNRLVAARLLTTTAGELSSDTWIDVSHEILIREWPRLREWIEQERDSLRLHRRLTAEAQEWGQQRRDRTLLLRGGRLGDALDWLRSANPPLNEAERAFLAASVRLRRARRGALALMAALLCLVATWAALPKIEEYRLKREAADLGPMVSLAPVRATLGGDGDGGHATVRVAVAAFGLDRHEVTNRQYRLCVQAGRCLPPSRPASVKRSFDEVDDRLPVVYITAAHASVFCRWLGRRLPTEAEWERAARGAHGRTWPWGAEPPSRERVNIGAGGERRRSLARVGDPDFAAGTSREGVTHLIGNVREFTSTPLHCRPNQYACRTRWDENDRSVSLITRGSSWVEPADPPSGGDALSADSTYADDYLGVRCARSE